MQYPVVLQTECSCEPLQLIGMLFHQTCTWNIIYPCLNNKCKQNRSAYITQTRTYQDLCLVSVCIYISDIFTHEKNKTLYLSRSLAVVRCVGGGGGGQRSVWDFQGHICAVRPHHLFRHSSGCSGLCSRCSCGDCSQCNECTFLLAASPPVRCLSSSTDKFKN